MKRFLKNYAIILLFFVSTLIVLGVLIFSNVLINSSARMLNQAIQQRLLAIAQLAADQVTAAELEQFQTPEDMEKPLYDELKERLATFSEKNDVLYTYYLRPVGSQLQFVVDNDWDPETRVDLNSAPVDMEPVPQQALDGMPASSDLGDYSVNWDGILAAYAPVYAADGSVYCIAGVDISDDQVVLVNNQLVMSITVQIFALIIALVSGIIGLVLYRKKAIQAESANMAKSQYLSSMSHEIRTPMNAIVGLGRMAQASEDVDDIKSYLSNIITSSNHLLRLINDILDLSKIESGKLVLDAAPVVLHREVESVETILRPQMQLKRQQFTVLLAPELPKTVCCDSTHLRQILVNLLSNAVKFTPEGGHITLQATLLDEREGACNIEWRVVDDGIGISPEQQRRLFTPFEQGDASTSRLYGGTGLGLAITRQLVELMGGHISVHSAPHEGSTFIFNTWLEIADDQPTHAPEAAPAVSTQKDALRGKTVLLVEDSEINRLIAENLLEGMGATVESAENGLAGLNLFLRKPGHYAMIFMDVQMPVMDGYEATRQIRASSAPDATTIPIIAMTANVFREDVQRALDAGMDAHVGKPFDAPQVEQAVLTALVR